MRTKIINIQFKRTDTVDLIIANDRQFPTYVQAYRGCSKQRLRAALKRNLQKFYPGVNFIFNYAHQPSWRREVA
jgi:hypothetical protein